MTFAEFKKLKIDTSGVGWEKPSKNDVSYFCTPKGAKMIGWAGADGVHYCSVRGLDETIFAVSPMNSPGRYVRPVARNFDDFLRLLLACLDLNLVEQSWMWDGEQLAGEIENVRNSEFFDPAPLDAIREKCGLEPMENPGEYLRRLQSSFNYAEIPFTEEYYETVGDADAWTPPAWKVTMDGGFFPERGEGGREIALDKAFRWGGQTWRIPSIYLCSGGVAADFFIEIDSEDFLRFRDEVRELYERGEATDEEQERLCCRNPANVDFYPTLTANGATLENRNGCGEAWYPASCLDDGMEENARAKYLVERYGFDLTKIWVVRRCFFPSETKIQEITSLRLKITRAPVEFYGVRFTNPRAGESYSFTHPVYGTERLLTVEEYGLEEIEENRFASEEWSFPTRLATMRYTVSPNLPEDEIFVRDCSRGDAPRRRKSETRDEQGAVTVGAIFSPDGPIAAAIGAERNATSRYACSSLYFEKPENVEWRVIFRVKTTEDLEEELL